MSGSVSGLKLRPAPLSAVKNHLRIMLPSGSLTRKDIEPVVAEADWHRRGWYTPGWPRVVEALGQLTAEGVFQHEFQRRPFKANKWRRLKS